MKIILLHLMKLGNFYKIGKYGVPRRYGKTEILYTQAYDLDDPEAA